MPSAAAELIARVKAKIAEADAVGAEAQAVADQLVKLFRKECEMRIALAAHVALDPNDSGAIGLNGVAVKERYMVIFTKLERSLNFGGGAGL